VRVTSIRDDRFGRPGPGVRIGESDGLTSDHHLSLSEVTKNYAATRALDKVSFDLNEGSVLALFGENGAGKSTLLSILAGRTKPDSGTVTLGEFPFSPRLPRDALNRGLALVAQELSPCTNLSVAENIVIGSWPNQRGITNQRHILRRAEELTSKFGVTLPLTKPLGEVSVGELQLVEILRVLNRNVAVVLMDEPTAALTAREADLVLQLIRKLAAERVTVVIVTHRIEEALSVADQVTVLRGGHLVLSQAREYVSNAVIVEAMLGRSLTPHADSNERTISNPADSLRLSGWTKSGVEPLDDVSFSISRGEIVGLYGVRGSGLETVARGLAGIGGIDSGDTYVGDVHVAGAFSNPRAREAVGVRFVPSDRTRAGLALRLSISTNLLFALSDHTLSRWIIRNVANERAMVRTLIDSYNIVQNEPGQAVQELSGGNQQKVLMAARLPGDYETLVTHEPTRGVDIGAREAVHDSIRRIARAGRGVLLISSDVDEIVELSDRAVIIRTGRMVEQLNGINLTVEQLLIAATGSTNSGASDGIPREAAE